MRVSSISLYHLYKSLYLFQESNVCRTSIMALQHIATHCNTLEHTATHWNTLQHTATSCSTLQHMATHLWHTSETMHVYKIRHNVWMCLTQTVWMCLKHCLNVCHTNFLNVSQTLSECVSHEQSCLITIHFWCGNLTKFLCMLIAKACAQCGCCLYESWL